MASSTDTSRAWFITGCSTGFGRALAERVLQRGYRCAVTARNPEQIQAIVAPYPKQALALALDVTNRTQMEQAVARAEAAFGSIDVLVNNAGHGYNAGVEEGEESAVRAMFETNFFGPWAVSRAFAPVLKANGGGAIVNVLSILSWLSLPGAATYSASKSAAWSLSNGLRNALREQGTQVLSLHVAFMDTDMTSKIPGPKASPDDVVAQTLAALEAGQFEVLADPLTQQVKQGLSTEAPPYAAAG